MDKKIHYRLSPEFVLLGFLYNHPSHGYELNKQLAEEFGYIWHVSQSQTYNILNRLVLQGYITSIAHEQEKLPPRRLLYLTDAGVQHFNDWLSTPTRCSVHAIRVEFITRLYFTQLYYPQKAQEMFRIQFAAVGEGIKHLRELRANLPDDQTVNCLALDLRIKLLDSILGWLKECQEAIAPPQTTGNDD